MTEAELGQAMLADARQIAEDRGLIMGGMPDMPSRVAKPQRRDNRARILAAMDRDWRPQIDIINRAGVAQATAKLNLTALADQGAVETKAVGARTHYRLAQEG